MSKLPLERIQVVEMGQIVAGPTAGLILADMGADVIKVEPPDAGSASRIGKMRNGSLFYFSRNKRGIVLDLACPDGKEVAMRADRACGGTPAAVAVREQRLQFLGAPQRARRARRAHREVLLELGYTVEEIEALARKAVVRGPDLPARP